MKRGTWKGPIKPWKKTKVEGSRKKNGKKNERGSETENERGVFVERKGSLRSEYSIDVGRWKHNYAVELEKWLARETRSGKGPVKEMEGEREGERERARELLSWLVGSSTEEEKGISGLKEGEECEKNGLSNDVWRSDKEDGGKVEGSSSGEEVVVWRRGRKGRGMVRKGEQ